jgi:uncharacterized repeat protein (TIGR02543 family)
MNNLLLAAQNNNVVYEPGWYVAMTILLLLLLSPWIYIIFKFGVFRKLRVRFIIDENTELAPLFLKKGEEITLPEAPIIEGKVFIGWFVDEERTEEYIPIAMPNYNIKLYAKYE